MSIEIWLPVVGYEGLYEISDLGRVRSLDRTVQCTRGSTIYTRTIRGKLKDPRPHPFGYSEIQLWRDGKPTDTAVHAVMLTAFVGPCPPGAECCHNDGDPTNSVLANLRWDTRSENQLDAVRHGTHFQTRKTECPQKHPYSAENTYVLNGHRLCRTCRRIRNREAARNRRRAA